MENRLSLVVPANSRRMIAIASSKPIIVHNPNDFEIVIGSDGPNSFIASNPDRYDVGPNSSFVSQDPEIFVVNTRDQEIKVSFQVVA